MNEGDVPVTIRRADVGDAGAIATLHVAAWQWAYLGLLPDTYLDRLPESLERRTEWRRLLLSSGDESRTWVAERCGTLIGFADTCPSRDEDAPPGAAELAAIYIDGSVKRQGVGRALLTHALTDLRARGFTSATLWVLDSNERARRFYEAMGWHPDGAKKTEQLADLVLHEVRYRIDLRPSI